MVQSIQEVCDSGLVSGILVFKSLLFCTDQQVCVFGHY